MENDREARQLLHYGVQYVECQGRRNKTTRLRVTRALLRSELVCTVAGTDRDSQRVTTRTSSEIDYLFRLRIVADSRRNLVLYTGQYTELSLNRYIKLMSIINHFLRQCDILLIRQRRSIDHHTRETEINTALAKLEAVSVIEVQADLRMLPTEFLSVLHSALCHVTQQRLVCIVTSTFRYLKNHRTLGLCSGLDDSLQLLHVIKVKRRDCITSLDSLSEHLTGVHQTQFLVTYHNSNLLFVIFDL